MEILPYTRKNESVLLICGQETLAQRIKRDEK